MTGGVGWGASVGNWAKYVRKRITDLSKSNRRKGGREVRGRVSLKAVSLRGVAGTPKGEKKLSD